MNRGVGRLHTPGADFLRDLQDQRTNAFDLRDPWDVLLDSENLTLVPGTGHNVGVDTVNAFSNAPFFQNDSGTDRE